jgi:hypothetical protein
MPLVDRGRTAFETPSISYLTGKMESDGPFRIFRAPSYMFAPNTPMLYDLDEIGGFDSLLSADYSHFFGSIDPKMSKNPRSLDLPSDMQTYMQPFWSFLGVRYLLFPSQTPPLPPPWRLAWSGEIEIFENTEWLPRWFMVHRIIPVGTLENAYKAAQAIDPSKEAVVMGIEHADIPPALLETPVDTPDTEPPTSESTESMKVLSYGPNSLVLYITADRDSFLVFSDTWFPGWRAWVDGTEAKVYRADAIVKGIIVPQGEHTVSFEYDPVSYKLGWVLFLIGLILTPFMIKPILRMNV